MVEWALDAQLAVIPPPSTFPSGPGWFSVDHQLQALHNPKCFRLSLHAYHFSFD